MTLQPEQFEQLPMFVSAREIRENYEHMDRQSGRHETTAALYDRKLKDVRENGWYRGDKELGVDSFEESVKKEGVSEPVFIGVDVDVVPGEKQLWDGHHRVATQFAHDPERLIPVRHGAYRSQNPELSI